MWNEKFKDKTGKTKYRYYEKYKDPYTDKWRRVSVVMNKDTKASQKEAMLKLEEKIRAKLNSKIDSSTNLKFHPLLDEWFEYYKKTNGSKITTIKNVKHIVNLAKRHTSSDLILEKIDLKLAQSLIEDLNDDGLTYDYLRRVVSIIKKSFKYAEKFYQYNNTRIFDDVTIPVKPKTIEDYEKEKQKRENYLEMEQVIQIRNCLLDHMSNGKYESSKRHLMLTAYIVELQALTGMRIGEALSLQTKDIDMENSQINIIGTIHWLKNDKGYGYKDTTKTSGSYRTITINQRTKKILKTVMLENKKLKQWSSRYKDRDFLFTNIYGNPILLTTINKNIEFAKNKLKIKKHITTHTFRHTHISLLVEMGITLKAIMKRVGHTNERTTINIYTHVTEKMDKQLEQKLEKIPY
ncbi:tyrosine-type recombinase/integrase [Staphylococcus nepalensis]|uniref:tyrosine-type recombinase/integrase n=1 Tax=Staphylococcus nepalensis TaxID=214473 RepID=UPI0011C9FCEE|nr:site-specific integrase [Staphylococcus nepalensis]